MKAIELSGRIDEERRLCIDQPIPVEGPRQVRVLILIPVEVIEAQPTTDQQQSD